MSLMITHPSRLCVLYLECPLLEVPLYIASYTIMLDYSLFWECRAQLKITCIMLYAALLHHRIVTVKVPRAPRPVARTLGAAYLAVRGQNFLIGSGPCMYAITTVKFGINFTGVAVRTA